jgi:hypothetical protein
MTTGDPADLHLGAESDLPEVTVGQSVTGLVHAAADADSNEHQTVLVYDGDPSQGDLVAATSMRGVSAESGGHATYTWTPTTPGVHELHQVILGTAKAGDKDEQIVRVTVLPAPDDGGSTPSEPGTSDPGTEAAGSGGTLAATGFAGFALAALAAALIALGVVATLRRRRRAG